MNEFWREADVIGSAEPKSPNGYSAHHCHAGRANLPLRQQCALIPVAQGHLRLSYWLSFARPIR